MLIFLFLLVCLLSMERAIEVLHCINKKGQTCTHPKKKKDTVPVCSKSSEGEDKPHKMSK